MKSMNIYLNFKDNTEEAFNFYKTVFGKEFSMLQRFKDIPESEDVQENDKDKIMHVSLPICDGYVLMGTDAPESMGFKINVGNNFYINLNVDSEEEADTLYKALSADGKVQMDLQNTFWGAYYGSLTDKFGIQWMINFEKKPMK